jgi:predicted phosphatase
MNAYRVIESLPFGGGLLTHKIRAAMRLECAYDDIDDPDVDVVVIDERKATWDDIMWDVYDVTYFKYKVYIFLVIL